MDNQVKVKTLSFTSHCYNMSCSVQHQENALDDGDLGVSVVVVREDIGPPEGCEYETFVNMEIKYGTNVFHIGGDWNAMRLLAQALSAATLDTRSVSEHNTEKSLESIYHE